MSSTNDEPQLELPLPLPAQQSMRLALALLLLVALIGGGVYAATDIDTQSTARAPSRPEDLSANIVTLVSPDDRATVASAVAGLKVAPPQRAEIEQAVIDGQGGGITAAFAGVASMSDTPRRSGAKPPAIAPALKRNFGDGRALLLVQDLQEFLDPLERLLMPLTGVDHAIAIALQRFRFGLT